MKQKYYTGQNHTPRAERGGDPKGSSVVRNLARGKKKKGSRGGVFKGVR